MSRVVQGHLLFDEIGTFLFANGLDLTALNLMCAHEYLSHTNQKLVLAIEEVLAYLRQQAGTHFDNEVVECWISAMTKT